MNSTSQFSASLFDELEPLFPDSNPSLGKSELLVATASETYAGVHLLLTGLTSGQFITLEALGGVKTQRVAPKGFPAVDVTQNDQHYKFFELIPLPVEANTGAKTRIEWTLGDINPDVIRRAPFMVYDVLKPCSNVIKATGSVMAVAFRCKVDAVKREVQKWELTIGHGGESKRLTFLVEAFPVKVEEVTGEDHKYVNWIGGKVLAKYHGVAFLSDEWYAIYEKYLTLAKYGRQNMVNPTPDMVFDYDGVSTPVFNEAKMDRLMAIYDKIGIYWIEGPHLAGRKDGEWEATLGQTILSDKVIPGEGEAELAAICNQVYSYVERHGLKDRWIQSLMDEPIDCIADTFKVITDIGKKSMPGIKLMDANIATTSIVGDMHIWCPTVDEYERYKEFYDAQVALGDELYVYTCLTPAGNYCNRLLDQERLRPVYIAWAPILYPNVTGYLHWGGMNLTGMDPYYLSAPLTDTTDYITTRRNSLPAGDPAIMFPGFYEAYSTTRLEAHRIGFEDLVLLERLKKQNPEQARELVLQVFRRYDCYEKDVSKYRATRRSLLAAVSEEGNEKVGDGHQE